MADDQNYDSRDEARMAELAIAAEKYKPFVLEVFETHGQQSVSVLIMLAANMMSCYRKDDASAGPAELTGESIALTFDLATLVVSAGPSVLTAFLYALGAEVSKVQTMLELAHQVDSIKHKVEP